MPSNSLLLCYYKTDMLNNAYVNIDDGILGYCSGSPMTIHLISVNGT